MARINLHASDEFERALQRFMRLRAFKTKSEAIRAAVREGLEREIRTKRTCGFSEWIGLGTSQPTNPHPRFRDDDDLWA